MKHQIPNSVYGPVNSWRLGRSLGIDLLCIDSICSFECVYCQLGKINRVTTKRDVFVTTERVISDLKRSKWRTADVITISGSGEPTLAKNLGEVIEEIKNLTNKPVIILTNSTLLFLPEVRREIGLADRIFCKLDAWDESSLHKIDRPAEGIDLESIISGIEKLSSEYDGFLAIQMMILRIPAKSEVDKIAQYLIQIDPDEVQLNLPTRPVPKKYFPETRGNEVGFENDFTRLKTVPKSDLEILRKELSNKTGLLINIR